MGPIERRVKKKRAERNISFAISLLDESFRKLKRIANKELTQEIVANSHRLRQMLATIKDIPEELIEKETKKVPPEAIIPKKRKHPKIQIPLDPESK